jgi:hypothetical protein
MREAGADVTTPRLPIIDFVDTSNPPPSQRRRVSVKSSVRGRRHPSEGYIETAARECEARGETDRAVLLREASTTLRAVMQPNALRRTGHCGTHGCRGHCDASGAAHDAATPARQPLANSVRSEGHTRLSLFLRPKRHPLVKSPLGELEGGGPNTRPATPFRSAAVSQAIPPGGVARSLFMTAEPAPSSFSFCAICMDVPIVDGVSIRLEPIDAR